MIRYLRSNALAAVALFVAIGGTSYAAFVLPPNSVGTKQLRNGAVTATKVRKGSLLAKDFKSGQLPSGRPGIQGPPGAPGASGAPGAAGTARAYAEVTSSGSFASSIPHPGFSSVGPAGTGLYCLTPSAGISPDQYPAVANAEWFGSPDQPALAQYRDTRAGGGPACSLGQYEVVTYDGTVSPPVKANEAFTVIVP